MLELEFLDPLLQYLPDYRYCETALLTGAGAGYFQPLNFLSNFLILIYAGYFYFRSRYEGALMGKYFVPAMIILGINSLAWHGLNHPLFLLLDIIGVVAVMMLLLQQYAIRLSEHHKRTTHILWAVALVIFLLGVVLIPLNLHAGGFFLIGLVCLGLGMVHSSNLAIDKMHHSFIYVGVLLTLAPLLRSADLSICHLLPIPLGTHFLWHLCVFSSVIILAEHMRYIPIRHRVR